MNSLYIHIPFCRQKCVYCDFYSVRYDGSFAKAYIDVLCRQIKDLETDFYTIYIGGGTPTVLETNLLEKLLKALTKVGQKAVEFTIEANPESVEKNKIQLLRDNGVTRMSLGVQSFDEKKLQKLGRIHSARQVFRAVELAKREGLENISIDLIFGVWQERFADWKKELNQAVKLPVNHISAYSLTYEKKTPIFQRLKNKEFSELDDKAIAEMYKYTMAYLPTQGFLQYEVSNFAQKGFECKHNLNYWQNNSYVGLGPSAVSYNSGVRTQNICSLKEYVDRFKNKKTIIAGKEKLSSLKCAKETAAIKIRTKEGINFSWFKEKTGFDFITLEQEAIRELITQGLIRYITCKNKLQGACLTPKGFLFSDSVSASFL